MKRTQPDDVVPFLGLPEPFAFKPVGKDGNPVAMPLIEKAVAAWRLLIERLGILNATPEEWAKKMRFSDSSLNHNWMAAMQRAGDKAIAEAQKSGADAETIRAIALRFSPVNCYRLKHSFSVRLKLVCGDTKIVQKALGHTSEKTTEIYTCMDVDPELTDAMKKFGR